MVGRSLLLFGLAFALTESYSFSERKWKYLLPVDTISELIQLDANATTDPVSVDRAIDTILRAQTTSILDQLDLPPYYERLPFVQRWQIKDVLFDRQLSYQQKHQMIHDIINKLPPEQQKFPPVNSAQHSRYFEAFSTLQYQVGFTFKLSELKRALPPRDMQSILHVLGNHQISLNDKLQEVERVMSKQSFEVLDRLFFTGVPIVDAEARERFRRLFVEKGFWMMPPNKPRHPNCLLKPWCNLKPVPKVDEEPKKPDLLVGSFNPLNNQQMPFGRNDQTKDQLKNQWNPAQINPMNGQFDPIKQVPEPPKSGINPMNGQMDSIKVESQPINVNENMAPKRLEVTATEPTNQETVKGSLVIQVQAANSAPIKQEIPLSQLQQLQTIVVESRRVDVDGIPKVNVVVHKSGSDSKPKDDDEKAPAIMKTAHLQLAPISNLPWQLPGSVQPSRVVKYGAPEVELATKKPEQTNEKSTDQPINAWHPIEPQTIDLQQNVQPTRWSILRQGPWTHQAEKTFLQKWYKHFGIALSDAGGFVPQKQVEQKQPEASKVEAEKDEPKDSQTPKPDEPSTQPATLMNPTTTQVPFSPAGEAHFQALREAHDKQEIKKAEAEKNEPKNEDATKLEPSAKLRDDPIAEAVRSETIRPPTVVINKEAKEKLVVRHSIKGSTLHLEKLTSTELRDNDNTTQQPKQVEKRENKGTTDEKLLQQPLNDTGADLVESVVADDSKKTEKTKTLTKEQEKEVPSGLLKLRDVLRRLRERIRQLPVTKNSTTFNWSQVQ